MRFPDSPLPSQRFLQGPPPEAGGGAPTYGPEMIVNGNFDSLPSEEGWTGTDVSFVPGAMLVNGSSPPNATYTLPDSTFAEGSTYRVRFRIEEIADGTSGNCTIQILLGGDFTTLAGGGASDGPSTYTEPKDHEYVVGPLGAGQVGAPTEFKFFTFGGGETVQLQVVNVSCQEVL